MARIARNLSTPESIAFWERAERSAAEVSEWPDWRRAGINVAQTRAEVRVPPESEKNR